jgi:cytoskeletal protein RodZ
VSIGDTLAEARRQAGLTITQVSQQTRIRESIIRSIEQGDFSSCGGDFYARGHIRSIAAVAGIDSAPLIREYDEEHGPPGGLRAAQIFEPATPIKIREPRPLHLGWVVTVAVLALAGFGVYHFWPHNAHSSATQTAKVRTAPAGTPTPAVRRTAAQQPAKPQTVIKLTARQDCWVGFNNPATGASLGQYTVPAGHTMTWKETKQVAMVIGNPPGIQLTVNGKPEQLNTVQVVTLKINPSSKTPVTVG